MFKRIASLLLSLALALTMVPQPGLAAQEAAVTGYAIPLTEPARTELRLSTDYCPTETEAYLAMTALKEDYPEGMPWTNADEYYWNGGIYSYGGGCVAFAFILSDAAFGTLPARQLSSGSFTYDDIRVGDILLMNNNAHTVIVLETYPDRLVIAEGNYNFSVHWGRVLTAQEVMSATNSMLTRYPEQATQPPSSGGTGIASGAVGNMTWVLNGEGLLTISGTGDMPYCTMEADVPWSAYTEDITSVVIEDGITSVGPFAFMNCLFLTEVTIPESVTIIHKYAFDSCKNLKAVTIPNSVRSIGMRAFYLCEDMQTLDLGQGVEILSEYAFDMCRTLTAVTIPASVVQLNNHAFASCEALATVTFLGDMPEFSGDVFSGVGILSNAICYYPAGNSTWTGMEGYGGRLTWTPQGETGEPEEPEEPATSGQCGSHVTWVLDTDGTLTISGTGSMEDYDYLGETAFDGIADRVFAIVIEDGVTRIGNNAFYSCKEVTEITIPESVAHIGENAFAGLWGLKRVELPEGMTQIDDFAFFECFGLNEILIPGTVTTIGEGAFLDCSDLLEIVLPDGVTTIEERAFAQILCLNSVTIPASITSIGSGAFQYNDRLSSVTFLGDAPSIAGDSFNGVTADVTYPQDNPTWTEAARQGYGGTLTWVPASGEGADTASGQCGSDVFWTLEADGALTISGTGPMWDYGALWDPAPTGNSPFSYMESPIRSIIVENGVTHIGNYAFHSLTELETVTLGNTVTTIGLAGFSACTSLRSVSLPEGLTGIADEAFDYCKKLSEITLPDSLTHIGTSAFQQCEKLTEVVLPQGITEISEKTFKFCDLLAKVTFPDGITAIGDEAFYGCGKLTELDLPDSLITIGQDAFVSCNGVAELVIPEGVTDIGSAAFLNCHGLTRLTIPGSTARIGLGAFQGCTALTEVALSEGVLDIGDYAFSVCTALTTVQIPAGVTRVGEAAFWNCPALTEVYFYGDAPVIGPDCFSEDEATVYYPPDNTTWTDALRQDYGGTLTWLPLEDAEPEIPDEPEQPEEPPVEELPTSGSCGGNVLWALEENGTLTISGTGPMADYTETERPEFDVCRDRIREIVIAEGVTAIGDLAFAGCSQVSGITFSGNAPAFGEGCFQGVRATAYYPASNPTWTAGLLQNYGGLITWIGEGSVQEPAILRTAGAHRYETAFQAANQMKKNLGITKFDTVVVASGKDFADALSGSYLAAVNQAPILLACDVGWINEMVQDYIRDNLKPGGTVYILGGVKAIPASFQQGLSGFFVRRLAGDNRFLTNLKVLEEAGVGSKDILVCTGMGFADSLSASATQLPILLVYGNALLPQQEAFLSSLGGNELYIIGGTGAVSETLARKLTSYGTPTRLAGGSRFETSVLIAEHFFEAPDTAVLAYAYDFPDGLCGGSLAATMGAPLILTMAGYEAQAAACVQAFGIQNGVILGGEKLIPDSSVDIIFDLP